MINRRDFVQNSLAGVALWPLANKLGENKKSIKPIVISTWNFGVAANAEAWKILTAGGKALDAVEAGVRVPEADPKVSSVGYGGKPDRDGHVSLDSCIMDEKNRCGGVAFLENIMHPVSVARKVMELTPHVLLCGEGALKFALDNGFEKTNLLTAESESDWKKWLEENKYTPKTNFQNHDTIGMLALDSNGDMAGACTTSGLAYKMHGRVGDSPIIGAGLFVDNEIGGATSTGMGEEVIRICGSHTVVEYMRHGYTPYQACKLTVERLIKNTPRKKEEVSAGFLALNKKGEYGAYAVRYGYEIAIHSSAEPAALKPIDHHFPMEEWEKK
jgi:N4-(beta-N-acetylglucosaminyl)-L-asparaginase